MNVTNFRNDRSSMPIPSHAAAPGANSVLVDRVVQGHRNDLHRYHRRAQTHGGRHVVLIPRRRCTCLSRKANARFSTNMARSTMLANSAISSLSAGKRAALPHSPAGSNQRSAPTADTPDHEADDEERAGRIQHQLIGSVPAAIGDKGKDLSIEQRARAKQLAYACDAEQYERVAETVADGIGDTVQGAMVHGEGLRAAQDDAVGDDQIRRTPTAPRTNGAR